MDLPKTSQQLNSALFIDFDNIYLNLMEQDRQAAEKFATTPDRWLDWLEKMLPINYRGTSFTGRRVLIRRCYLNPNSFSQFRPHFIRSACEVIDCPPLTSRGKTSTDIHMVMDMLEALGHNTYFHEFIVLSGDADFTPLLLRLRKHARYSAVLSVGYVSPAYKAACDYIINQSAFVETALGISFQEEEEQDVAEIKEVNKTTEKILKRMAERVHKEAMSLPSGIPGNDLPELYKESPEFRQSNHWLGFYSLKRLTEAIVQRHNDLTIVEDEDSWFVSRKIFANWLYSSEEKASQSAGKPQELRSQIATWIKGLVEASSTPIVLGALAQSVHKKFADQDTESNWLGAGTFKNLLQQLDLGSLEVSSEAPGYIYDPVRHTLPANGQVEEVVVKPPVQDVFLEGYPDLAPLARKIHQLTDMPYLMPEHYALLFREIAREVNERGYQMTRTSRTVRDRCIERGAPIARSHVNFVLTGLSYVGHRIGDNGKPEEPEELARLMVKNTINLCDTAQFELSPEEKELVEKWLVSGIVGEDNSNGSE